MGYLIPDLDKKPLNDLQAADVSVDPSMPSFNPDMLKQAQADQDAQKDALAKRAIIFDALSNRQSEGNFARGMLNPEQNTFQNAAAQKIKGMVSPYDRQKQLLDAYRASKGEQRAQAQEGREAGQFGMAQKKFQNEQDEYQAKNAPEIQYYKNLQDPDSQESQLTKSIALGAVQKLATTTKDPKEKAMYDQLAQQVQSSNGYQVHQMMEKNPLVKDMFTSSAAGQKLEAMLQSLAVRQQTQDRRISDAENRDASKAGQSFENDSMLKQLKGTINSLDRAKSIMDGNTPVTAANFNMLQQDLINAVAQGGAATEGKVNREMVNTLMSELNEVKQRFGNIQDLRKEQPQVFEQLRGLMNQVYGDYNKAINDQALHVHSSYESSDNDKVKDTIKRKLKEYAPQAYEAKYGSDQKAQPQNGQPMPQPTPADNAALDWAKKNPTDPRAAQILKLNGIK